MFARLMLSLTLLSLTAASAEAQTPALGPSTWVNQRGSTLTITDVDGTGAIKGTFVNKAPDTDCQNKPYDLKGRLVGQDVIIATDFMECLTVTVWHGQVAGTIMTASFEAAFPNKSGKIDIWRDSDTFTRQ